MLSKSQIKLINSLQQRKYRTKYGVFVVEGEKSVLEFLASNYELDKLFYTATFDFNNNISTDKLHEINEAELYKISFLKNPNRALATFKIPQQNQVLESDLTLVLDAIQDPGNLGTIIRLATWFGIKNIVCSPDTVNCYNPKVVQATMGSLTRVQVIYTNIKEYLLDTNLPIFASLLNGENIYKATLPKKAIIIMGNEGNGISKEIITLASNKLNIPQFGTLQQTESLNVATATAIILSAFCGGK